MNMLFGFAQDIRSSIWCNENASSLKYCYCSIDTGMHSLDAVDM
jgi:hypothetical protein